MDEDMVVVCAAPGASRFGDNVAGHCAECGAAIAWRPYVPEPSIKLCIACGFASMNEAEDAGHDIELVSLPEQVAELEALEGPGAVAAGHAIMEALRKQAKD